MTQATADLPETAPVDQTDEQFDDDLEAGFAGDAPDETPTTTPDLETEASADPDDDTTPVESTDETKDEQPNELIQRITTLEANHKKYSDDVFGRVGMLEQVLKAQARTPAGQKVQVKLEDFGEFGEEYPEFAKAQAKVMNQVLSQLEMTGLSQEFTEGLIKNARTTAEQAAEARYEQRRVKETRRELDGLYPGWTEIVGLPEKDVKDGGIPPDTEFRRWLKTQPNNYESIVLDADSSLIIGRALDKFTQFKESQKPKPKPQATGSSTVSRREQQLRSAVAVKSTGVQPRQKKEMTFEEAMNAGFEGRV